MGVDAPEALTGDLAASLPGGDSRRAAIALAQLLGPFRAVHDRFPSVPELRELLEGSAEAVAALRSALAAAPGQQAQARELDARERQSGRPGDVGPLLADRIALLDRPAFAGFFGTSRSAAGESRPFSLRSLEHPLRVRIDLPERGHAEASRMLARLVLAQFTESAVARADRSLFACLVLDDASHTISADALRGLQRLRSANAGAVLTLRTLDDVPEPLRASLLGAVGCRMAFAGVTTWDGARFAEVWGKVGRRTPQPGPGGSARRGGKCQLGCHSSMRLPSGSVTQPNRPTPSMSSDSAATSAPLARSCASIASRSRTRKLSMVCWAREPK